MGDEYWVHCPYAQSDECPQSDAIVRVYLFPQLLDPADIDSIKQTCKTCGKYLDQKRKHPRIKRPLQIVLIKERQTAIKGNIVDVSEGGALIQLQTWADFKKDEKVLFLCRKVFLMLIFIETDKFTTLNRVFSRKVFEVEF